MVLIYVTLSCMDSWHFGMLTSFVAGDPHFHHYKSSIIATTIWTFKIHLIVILSKINGNDSSSSEMPDMTNLPFKDLLQKSGFFSQCYV